MAGVQRRLKCNCPEGSPFHWAEDYEGKVQWAPRFPNRSDLAKESLEKRKAKGEDVSVPMDFKRK